MPLQRRGPPLLRELRVLDAREHLIGLGLLLHRRLDGVAVEFASHRDLASEGERETEAASLRLVHDATFAAEHVAQHAADGNDNARAFLARGVPAATRGEAAQLQLERRRRYEARTKTAGQRFEWYQETLALPPASSDADGSKTIEK